MVSDSAAIYQRELRAMTHLRFDDRQHAEHDQEKTGELTKRLRRSD